MRRTVNLVGTGTLTVSLPSKWAKDNNLKKGDELEVIENGKELLVKTEIHKDKKIISIDLTHLKNSTLVNVAIVSFLRRGYKRIEVKYSPFVEPSGFYSKKKISTFLIIQQLVSYYIGVEIVEEKQGFCVIEELVDVDNLSFQNSFNRGFLLLLELSKPSQDLVGDDETKITETGTPVIGRFYMIDKFFKYSLKVLDNSNLSKEEIQRISLLINHLDIIGYDIAVFKTFEIKKEEDKKVLGEISGLLRIFYNQCLKPEIESLNDFTEKLNWLQKKLISSDSKSI